MLTEQKYDGTLSEEIVTPLTHDPLHQALSFPFLSSEHFHVLQSPRASVHDLFEKSHMLQIPIKIVILLLFITLYRYYYYWLHLLQSTVFPTSFGKYFLLFLCVYVFRCFLLSPRA